MTDLAKLVVRLEAQTGQYQAQLERAQGQLQRFEKAGSSILRNVGGAFLGIVSAGAILSLGNQAIDAADRMNDLSKSTGIGVETLSRLDYAAQQSGSSTEALTTAFRKLAKSAVEAKDGTGPTAKAFADLGVSVTDANGALKPTEQLLLETAEAFSQYEDGAEKSATAQAIFGKSGSELIPFLNEGAKGIKALTDEADRLGITMSGAAAKAADEFNDSLATSKAVTQAFFRDALTPMLPMLTDVVGEFNDAAGGARDFSGAADVLQTGLKILTTVGLTVAHSFRRIGNDLGALAAAAVQFATGHFREAATVIRERNLDIQAENEATAKAFTRVWSGAMDETLDEVTVKAKKIGLAVRAGIAGPKGDGLTEIAVSAAKSYVSPMEAMYDRLDAETQTATERQISAFNKTEAALNALRDAGRIDQSEYAKRYSEALDDVLPEVEIKVEKIGNKIKQETVKVSEFTKRAMELTVDTIADGLYGAIKGGLKDIPEAFADMLLKLALQAQAAKIGEALFGTEGNGYKGSGFLGTIGSLIGSVVGPGRAGGGTVVPGSIYPVNEQTANSEYFAPGMMGTIIPNKAMRAKQENHFHFTVPAPSGSVSRQTQAQIASSAARGMSQANRKNN